MERRDGEVRGRVFYTRKAGPSLAQDSPELSGRPASPDADALPRFVLVRRRSDRPDHEAAEEAGEFVEADESLDTFAIATNDEAIHPPQRG
jgi:hypothetical protein